MSGLCCCLVLLLFLLFLLLLPLLLLMGLCVAVPALIRLRVALG